MGVRAQSSANNSLQTEKMAIIRTGIVTVVCSKMFYKVSSKNEKIVQALFNGKYASAFNLFLKPWNRNVIASVENVTICLILVDKVNKYFYVIS